MVRIGLLPFDILWENVSGNIQKIEGLLSHLQPGQLDLVVLPELWTVGFTMNHDAHKSFQAGFEFMQAQAKRLDCAIIGGLPAFHEGAQENRCYFVHSQSSASYTKNRVFKFAGEHLKYRQGKEGQLWNYSGFRICPFVCYDLRFPELARRFMPDANLLVYVANWPTARSHHWRQLLIARAIENLCYVVGVNRVGTDGKGLEYIGPSLIVDPTGQVILESAGQEGLITATIYPEVVQATRERFPFLDDML